MLLPKLPTVARAGCVAKARSTTSTLLGPLKACPRSYPFPRLPQISFQTYKPTLVSATTCFASPTSCVANSPATATWPVTAPLCPAPNKTDTASRYSSSSPFLNVTTEAAWRSTRQTSVTTPSNHPHRPNTSTPSLTVTPLAPLICPPA
jgi:hypothetical protein